MHKRFFLSLVIVALASSSLTIVNAQRGNIMLWVQREYSSWDNPLHSEFSINGKLVNVFTSDTFEEIQGYVKEGWNTISITTTPQEPASKNNGLIFRIGPAQKDEQRNRMVMSPVLWEFRNDTDWKFNQGTYSHPLGPDVKKVTLTFPVYFVGMLYEDQELKAGDFILSGKPKYGAWNSPVAATVLVNGTSLNTFMLQRRQIVITSLLKPGKNEIKLISGRVKNAIRDNDIEFSIAGPAEWNVQKGEYVVTPLVQFRAMQGWTRNATTGMLINPAAPDSETIERVIPFVLKEGQAPAKQ